MRYSRLLALLALLLAVWPCMVNAQARLPGEYLTTIRPERLTTPFRSLAPHYVHGPLKVLFFAPELVGGQDVAELCRRFPITMGSVLYDGPPGDRTRALSSDDIYVGAVQGTLTPEKMAAANKLLEEHWDAFVFANTYLKVCHRKRNTRSCTRCPKVRV